MARTTKTPTATAEATVSDSPTYRFKSFTWAPDDVPSHVMVQAKELSKLVNHVKDVASGAATVFQLMLAHDQEIDMDNATYLSPCSIAVLQQLAIRALQSLNDEADDIVTHLNEMEGAKS